MIRVSISRGVFPFIDALTGCRALSTKEKRDKEGGQPRHSGFVPLIVPDNSLPLSRYVNLSPADTYLSLLVRNRLKLSTLNSVKFSDFIASDFGFTIHLEFLSKLRKFSINIRKLP